MTVKRYTKKEKAAALKRIKAGESVSAVSRDLKIPRSTLIGWKKDEATGARARKKTTQAREKKSDTPTGDNVSHKEDSQNVYVEKKKHFSDDSWGNIDKAQQLLNRRLTRALECEDALDEMVNIVLETSEEDLDYKQKMTLINKLRTVKVEDIKSLVVSIGTLYDKQALANGDKTGNVSGEIVLKFEDL